MGSRGRVCHRTKPDYGIDVTNKILRWVRGTIFATAGSVRGICQHVAVPSDESFWTNAGTGGGGWPAPTRWISTPGFHRVSRDTSGRHRGSAPSRLDGSVSPVERAIEADRPNTVDGAAPAVRLRRSPVVPAGSSGGTCRSCPDSSRPYGTAASGSRADLRLLSTSIARHVVLASA